MREQEEDEKEACIREEKRRAKKSKERKSEMYDRMMEALPWLEETTEEECELPSELETE